jgi:hypothetical protein
VVAAIAAASAVSLLGPATASPSSAGVEAAGLGSGPLATAAAENLVRYLPSRTCKPKPRRCKIRREIAFFGICSADCNVRVRMVLRIRGRRIGPFVRAGSFAAGQVFRGFITLNRPAVRALRANRTRSRFITSIRAVEVGNPANFDIDRRTFRFVRG